MENNENMVASMDWGLLSVALVWLVLALVSLSSAAALVVLGRKAWRKGLVAVLAALLLMVLAAATQLLALPRLALPEWNGPLLGSVCFSLVLAAMAVALRQFRQLDIAWSWLLLPPLAVLALGLDIAPWRVYATVAVLALQGAWLALELKPMHQMQLGLGYHMLSVALPLLVLGMALLQLGFGPQAQGEPALVYALQLLWLPLAVLLLALGFMRMAQDRREARSRRAALRDPLTRMLNRRALERVLEHCIKGATQEQRPLALLLVDVDHFKRVNDTYGHISGDKVLRHISRVLASNVRNDTYLGRFGGEEFVVVCPGAGMEDAQILAERLNLAVRSSSVQIQGQALRVTASIGGYAGMVQPGMAWEDVLEVADAAMYRAKAAGRDRVVMLRELLPEAAPVAAQTWRESIA